MGIVAVRRLAANALVGIVAVRRLAVDALAGIVAVRSPAAGALFLSLLFLALVVRNSWVVEEAYISFRTVDNFISGYGLRWNTHERVCSFTNPLWTLLVAGAAFVTREVFFTSIAIQVALAAATAFLLMSSASSARAAIVVLTAICLSKAAVDWSTSGMENGLGHLLYLLVFLGVLGDIRTQYRLAGFVFVAALGALNRLDTLLITGPVVAALLWRFHGQHRSEPSRTFRFVLLGLSPLIVWLSFSLVYYGFPLPNTFYAKLSTGLPARALSLQGLRYVHYSLITDPITVFIILSGVGFGLFGRLRARLWPMAFGVVLFTAYVIHAGGDFMAGRFWSLPFVASLAILGQARFHEALDSFGVVVATLLGLGWAAGFPTLNRSYHALRSDASEAGIADYARGSFPHSSLEWALEHSVPTHPWISQGKAQRDDPSKVPIWGGVGYAGYYAGPQVVIIDKYGLTDALLAHIPVPDAKNEGRWRIGHFERAIPDGYLESVKTRKNLLRNAELARIYDDLRLVQSGPIFSWKRFVAILRLNAGVHRKNLEKFLVEYDRKRTALSRLPPARLANEAWEFGEYSYFLASTESGVRFSEKGLVVELERLRENKQIVIGLDPGDYEIQLMRSSEQVWNVRFSATSRAPASISVPPPASAGGYDSLIILPTGSGRRDLVHLELG